MSATQTCICCGQTYSSSVARPAGTTPVCPACRRQMAAAGDPTIRPAPPPASDGRRDPALVGLMVAAGVLVVLFLGVAAVVLWNQLRPTPTPGESELLAWSLPNPVPPPDTQPVVPGPETIPPPADEAAAAEPIPRPRPDEPRGDAEPMKVGPEKPTPEPKPAGLVLKRRDRATADELGRRLQTVPEIDLNTPANPKAGTQIVSAAKGVHRKIVPLLPDSVVRRADLGGLPYRTKAADCQLGKDSAQSLSEWSRKVRFALNPPAAGFVFFGPAIGARAPAGPDVTAVRKALLDDEDADDAPQRPEAVAVFVQLLQAEDKPFRLLLIELLQVSKRPEASAALAQRAVFDVSEEVREAAVKALVDRPAAEYRSTLLAALRHPFAPAADHAAEALAALKDREAVPALVKLLDEPDPLLPLSPADKTREPVVRELVRMNHHRNCLLCHAPSFAGTDPARTLTPTPGQPLPPPVASPFLELTTPTPRGPIFVRADVTYLKQEFAVSLAVAKPGTWPGSQPFDYLVRTRYANGAEKLSMTRKRADTYPQKEAVRFALVELTGRDAGKTAAEWRAVLGPPAGVEP